MGNASTERTKRNERRTRIRKITLDTLDEQVLERLARIPEPLQRADALVRHLTSARAPDLMLTRAEQWRWKILVDQFGREGAAQWLHDQAPAQLDDRGYRPKHVDATLRGAARATGQAAKAIRRGSTVTGWQHAEREGSGR